MSQAFEQSSSATLASADDGLVSHAIDGDCVACVDGDGGYSVKQGVRILAFAIGRRFAGLICSGDRSDGQRRWGAFWMQPRQGRRAMAGCNSSEEGRMAATMAPSLAACAAIPRSRTDSGRWVSSTAREFLQRKVGWSGGWKPVEFRGRGRQRSQQLLKRHAFDKCRQPVARRDTERVVGLEIDGGGSGQGLASGRCMEIGSEPALLESTVARCSSMRHLIIAE